MRIAQEEIFGPVTAILGWKEEEDVLSLANSSEYGLASGIWTRDLGRTFRMSRKLHAGVVWANRYYNFTTGLSGGPYPGSGFGREMGHEAALENYTNEKTLVVNLDERPLGLFSH